MKLSHEDIREILSIVEASSFDSIEFQVGDIKLAASKSGPQPRSGAAPAARPAPVPEPTKAAAPDPAPKTAPAADEEGLIEVTAPILGTFYIAPEPGAVPFVTEGDKVDEITTVGIIEVMKVFNDIKAERAGTVVRCLVEDGAFVEFGQPILLIRPEA
ncbi:acetyl-CoA carboxylase biotin carboxyl carrier protein (plasmid) [Sulfitobacter faviae]|uniref:Biotin carboxyl carrier protein of acetyl-CoA carboxylase n=1 Tax=Sulfitobacter faviae TaxID=1775881 RepID=A0ABZ0VAA4_9RHOB|nr:acetyl-CoA carboxylase biotin carboxyl carrier protein [Sulfitobacter faviae]WPZ23957.1 acetyl-CoA carboxylase biotin carboxyl carrier protein [Sulfitobacter faviae]